MDFLGMGMGEILLILVVALIIWGPRRMVEIGQWLGKAVRTLRKVSFDLTTQISKELSTEEKDSLPRSGANGDDKTKESSDAGKTEPSSTERASSRE